MFLILDKIHLNLNEKNKARCQHHITLIALSKVALTIEAASFFYGFLHTQESIKKDIAKSVLKRPKNQ